MVHINTLMSHPKPQSFHCRMISSTRTLLHLSCFITTISLFVELGSKPIFNVSWSNYGIDNVNDLYDIRMLGDWMYLRARGGCYHVRCIVFCWGIRYSAGKACGLFRHQCCRLSADYAKIVGAGVVVDYHVLKPHRVGAIQANDCHADTAFDR